MSGMSAEEWRPVIGAPGYEVSNQGRVRSWRRAGRNGTPRIHADRPDRLGYRSAVLWVEGQRVERLIHRLVLEAFVGPQPSPLHETRHLNGIRHDNRPENLAWGTRSENVQDQILHGTHALASRTHCANSHEYTPTNTRLYDYKGSTRRICRTCSRERQREYVQRKALRRTRELRAA